MWSLVAARLPPGKPRADILRVFSKYNISFQVSTDSDDLHAFLKSADFKNKGIQNTPLTNNPLDQITFDPECSSTRFPEDSLDQNGPFTSSSNVPMAFSKIPDVFQTTDAVSRQIQENNTVIQKPLVFDSIPVCEIRSLVPRRQREENNSEEDSIDSNNSFSERVVKEDPEESEVNQKISKTPKTILEANLQQTGYGMEPISIGPDDSERVVKEEIEDSVTQTPLPRSSDPFIHEVPVDIFEDIKPAIDLTTPRVVIAEVDLTKDLDKVKEEQISDDEMEDDELEATDKEEDMSDAGAHLDPKDKEYTPKGSSLKKKPSVCDVCQKVFFDGKHRARHMRIHTGVKLHQCAVCQKRFCLKETLTIHLRTHTGEKPCKCDRCGRSFSRPHILTGHMRTHTGEKPYQCDVCQKEFSRKDSCERHMLVHSGEKRYACEVCKQRFGQKEHLKRHLRVHTGEKPFKCKDCNKIFRYSSSLKEHRSRFHP